MYLDRSLISLIRLLVLTTLLWGSNVVGSGLINANNVATTTSPSPAPTPSTIIDILSSQVQFSSFLTLLQKNGLIPYINSLQNVTLLAPVNLAFIHNKPLDNRDTLLRYIIDQKFRVGYMSREPILLDTLYQVHNKTYQLYVSPNFDTLEYEIDKSAAIVEYDIYAKHQWSFIQAIDSQVAIKPTMCDILLNDEPLLNGVDVSFMKSVFKLLFIPSYGVLKKKKKHDKHKIIPQDCESFLKQVGTILIPSNDMINQSMSTMTQRYYSTLYHALNNKNFATTDEAILEIKYDITKFLWKLFLNETIAPGNTTTEPVFSVDKMVEFDISGYDDSILVNDVVQSVPNASTLAADGMFYMFDASINQDVNFFDDLSIELVDMIPRKSLFAMHYSDFVSELSFRSLDYLIDGTSTNKTIFLSKDQKDDFSEDASMAFQSTEFGNGDVSAFSFSNKQRLLYQILDMAVNITDETTSRTEFYLLADTLMCSKNNINGCYKLKVSRSFEGGKDFVSRVNDGINIVSDPIDIGSGIIAYIVNKDVEAPESFKHTLANLLSNGGIPRHLEHIQINQAECLRTIQYLKDFNLLSLPRNEKGYSAFLPCGIPTFYDDSRSGEGSWEHLGLILNHLEKNPNKFKSILKGIFIEDQIFSDFGLNDNNLLIISRTLEGDSLEIKSGQFTANYDHILQVNNTNFSIPLNSDLIFDQGVIHIVDKLLMPTSFEISLVDLIKATEDEAGLISFMDLLEGFPKVREILSLDSIENLNYSILVPSQDSLITYNVTKDFKDLLEVLELHIIPNSELPLIFDCMDNKLEASESNDSNGPDIITEFIRSFSNKTSFSCRQNSKGKMVFDVNNSDGEGTGHKIKILNYGCTSMDDLNHSRPCVFMIDRPIQFKWLEKNDGFLHIHLGYMSIAVGIILGLVVFSILIFMLIFCLSGRESKHTNPFKPYEEGGYMHIGAETDEHPLDGGYETDDDMLNERVHLLPTDDSSTSRRYGAVGVAKPLSIKGSQNKSLNRFRNLPDI